MDLPVCSFPLFLLLAMEASKSSNDKVMLKGYSIVGNEWTTNLRSFFTDIFDEKSKIAT